MFCLPLIEAPHQLDTNTPLERRRYLYQIKMMCTKSKSFRRSTFAGCISIWRSSSGDGTQANSLFMIASVSSPEAPRLTISSSQNRNTPHSLTRLYLTHNRDIISSTSLSTDSFPLTQYLKSVSLHRHHITLIWAGPWIAPSLLGNRICYHQPLDMSLTARKMRNHGLAI